MSQQWIFLPVRMPLPINIVQQMDTAAHKCSQCQQFGHLEIDCQNADKIRAVLREKFRTLEVEREQDRPSTLMIIGTLLLLATIVAIIWWCQ